MEEQGPPRSVEELMSRYTGVRHDTAKKVFGVRLDPNDLASLDVLSRRLGVARSTLARDLLSAALREAFSTLQFEDADDQADFFEEAARIREELWMEAMDEMGGR